MSETLAPTKPRIRRRIPESLVYERWGGRTYYRRGYREVLKGLKTEEEIMGASGLQAFIVSYIFDVIAQSLDKSRYRTLVSEPGIHLKRNENLSADILIYDKSVLTPDKITTRYVDVPPKVCVEVDVKIDLEKISDVDYVFDKARTYLDFGAESVFWALSSVQKVFVFRPGQEAVIYDWATDLELLDGVTVNIGRYLVTEGVELPKKA
jgi:Uma2 family endonuclease